MNKLIFHNRLWTIHIDITRNLCLFFLGYHWADHMFYVSIRRYYCLFLLDMVKENLWI